jgi:hypothetical protein
MRTKHLREQARFHNAPLCLFFAFRFKSSYRKYLYIDGLPGVRNPEYLEQLRFFNPPAGKRIFLGKRRKGMSDLGFVDL